MYFLKCIDGIKYHCSFKGGICLCIFWKVFIFLNMNIHFNVVFKKKWPDICPLRDRLYEYVYELIVIIYAQNLEHVLDRFASGITAEDTSSAIRRVR